MSIEAYFASKGMEASVSEIKAWLDSRFMTIINNQEKIMVDLTNLDAAVRNELQQVLNTLTTAQNNLTDALSRATTAEEQVAAYEAAQVEAQAAVDSLTEAINAEGVYGQAAAEEPTPEEPVEPETPEEPVEPAPVEPPVEDQV